MGPSFNKRIANFFASVKFNSTWSDVLEKILLSRLLSKKLKVKIYKTIILPVVLYGCETWSLTLREEHRLRVLENKVLREIFGTKRDEITGNVESYIMLSYMQYILRLTYLGILNCDD